MIQIDDMDFKKTRGYIFAASIVTFLIPLLNVDIHDLSFFGLKANDANDQHLWILWSIAIFYLLLRLYQMVKFQELRFDERRVASFIDILFFISALASRSTARRKAKEMAGNACELKMLSNYHSSLPDEGAIKKSKPYESTEEKWERNKIFMDTLCLLDIKVMLNYKYKAKSQNNNSSIDDSFYIEYEAKKFIKHCSSVASYVVTSVKTTWFTDFVLPLLLGASALIVSIYQQA